ncbi:MAG: hypothetical protein ACOYK1_02625 [Vampirovibrionia bacterium]
MSSNAVSNQPTTGFFARAKEQLLEKFNIASKVESSSTNSKKLTSEGKETYKTNIEKSLSGVNIDSIQEKDADSGILRSKVFTLDNTASDEIAKMSEALTLTLELINKSGGAEKTFMAQNSTDALKDRVLELAVKISDTKNDDDPARASLKSLASTVVEKSFPKLLDNGKTGLTQDETQAIKMMLFSNNDAAAFAGAVKLLQSVKSYEEVAVDSVKEKTLSDGTKSLKANPDSVYKKILNAVGSGSVGTHITEILKATVDKALHGRLTKDEQDILKTDPSLRSAYDTVHRDLISKVEQRSRENIIKPLKEDLNNVSKDPLVSKYFGDSELSENKIISLVKKTVQGIINMVRPSGNEFSKRAFGPGSFYDSSLKLNTLADKVDTDIRHLTNLENRVGMTQDRLATGSSTKLDIPLDVIARKNDEGADTVAKLIKFIAGDVEKHADYDPKALEKWQAGFKVAAGDDSKIVDIQSPTPNAAVQAQIAGLANSKETSIGGLLVTKLLDDTSSTSSVQVKLGSDTVTTNAEGASRIIESYKQHIEAQRKSEEGCEIANRLAKAYLAVDSAADQGKTLREQLVNIKDNLSGAESVRKLTSALKQDSDLITYNFGLESSRKTGEESILKLLAKLAPETREDLVSVKSTIEEATSKATKLIKDESKAVPHLAMTTGQAIHDGLLSSDGETFKVSSALGQHLFDSVQQSVGKEADAAHNKLLDQKFARVNDIGKADTELTNTTSNLVKSTSVEEGNYHEAVVKLNSELQKVTDRYAKAFVESFKNSNQDLLDASNYKGEPTEDKARFNLLMSKLVDSALELKDDNTAGYAKVLTDARVGDFIDTTRLAAFSDTDRNSMNKRAAVLSEVLDSMPDAKEIETLSKISRGTIRSFQSLEALNSPEWKRKIVDKMVTGFLEMARTGAVKLDSIQKIISTAGNSSNTMENLLKDSLVSRLQGAAV